MSEIEKEQSNSFLKGIEHIFLKITGGARSEKISKKQQQELINQDIERARLEARRKEKEQNDLLYAQKQQATKLLEANLYDLYFAMINNGYKPTKEQVQNFDHYINDLIGEVGKKHNMSLINHYINLGYKLSDENTYQFLSELEFQKQYFSKEFFNPNHTYIINEYNLLINNLRDNIFSDNFKSFAGKKFLNSFSDNRYYSESFSYKYPAYSLQSFPFMPHSILNITTFINYMPHIVLHNTTSSDFINFISKMAKTKEHIDYFFSNPKLGKLYSNHSYDKLSELLNKTLHEYYSQDLTQMLHQTKMLHSKHYLEEQAIKKTQLAIGDYKVNALPKKTQNLINSIEVVYTSLDNQRKILNDDQLFLIDNLFDKRIPEVLSKYFSIDQEYRETMRTAQNKSAQDLMDESLTNFKNKLEEILQSINAAKLSDLNVTQRYSNSI